MASTLTMRNITVGPLTRTYTAAVPPGAGPFPVLFAFHGGGETALAMQQSTKIEQTTQGSQLIVVYPQGYQNNWNVGGGTGNPAYALNINDLGFITAMLADLPNFTSINTSQVYGCGYSNGGALCYVVSAQLPHTFAAILTNCSVMWLPTTGLTPVNPLPVWIVHGDDDIICPYAGGSTVEGFAPPVSQTVSFWVSTLAATYKGSQTLWGGGAEEKFYVNGSGQMIVRNDIVARMGHRWTGTQFIQGQSAFFIHGNQSYPLGPFCYPEAAANFDNDMITWMLEFSVT